MAHTIATHDAFTQEVLNFPGVVLVDFYADRCGPCRMLTPIVEELSEQYAWSSTIKIVKINVDENQETPSLYDIMSIPAVLIFKNGELKHQDVGVQMKEVYENKISALV